MVLNDDKSKQAHLGANFFVDESEDGQNQFGQWLFENKDNFLIDVCKKVSQQNIKQMDRKKKTSLKTL